MRFKRDKKSGYLVFDAGGIIAKINDNSVGEDGYTPRVIWEVECILPSNLAIILSEDAKSILRKNGTIDAEDLSAEYRANLNKARKALTERAMEEALRACHGLKEIMTLISGNK